MARAFSCHFLGLAVLAWGLAMNAMGLHTNKHGIEENFTDENIFKNKFTKVPLNPYHLGL